MGKLAGQIQIGRNRISMVDKPYVIAEIGSNHNQEIETAICLIQTAAKSGANAAKFQLFTADDLVARDHPARNVVEKATLNVKWVPLLINECKKFNLDFLCSTFGLNEFKELENYEVEAHKIASSEILNTELLIAAGKSTKPVLLSTGMTDWFEIEIAVEQVLSTGNNKIIPLHCSSKYPLETELSNLLVIKKLQDRFGGISGFSDHTESVETGGWAVILGARVMEKHLTLDRGQEGPDHSYALEPGEFQKYVSNIQDSFLALGDGEISYLPEEIIGRRRTSVFAKRYLEIGQVITSEDVECRGPRKGIPGNLLYMVIGQKVSRFIASGEVIQWNDLG
jgi:sialic acid synthase SpsE